jgi:hypothetical protein
VQVAEHLGGFDEINHKGGKVRHFVPGEGRVVLADNLWKSQKTKITSFQLSESKNRVVLRYEGHSALWGLRLIF